MSDRTSIEWTRSPDGTPGASWNPIRARHRGPGKVGWACTKPSEGCQFCYAERLNRLRGTGEAYTVSALKDVELFLDERVLLQPLWWRRPRRIFVASMTDLFLEQVPDDAIADVWLTMLTAPQHTFLVLTKRAERMARFVPWLYDAWARKKRKTGNKPLMPLPNVWLGVSAENQRRYDERRKWLEQTPAVVRFWSLEPLLGPIDMHLPVEVSGETWVKDGQVIGKGKPGGEPWIRLDSGREWSAYDVGFRPLTRWVIAGGESGGPPERALVKKLCECGDYEDQHKNVSGGCWVGGVSSAPWDHCKRFRFSRWDLKPEALDWLRSIRDQCQAAGVAFFYKQAGGPTAKSGGRLLDGQTWNEAPNKEGQPR